jgi:hypothetical protein
MTIEPTRSTPVGSIGASAPVATGDAARLLHGLTTSVIGGIAASFGIGPAAPGQGDIYGLGQLGDAIVQTFGGGTAAEAGALARALEEYAGAVAADMAAHADGRTLEFAEAALSDAGVARAGDIGGFIDALSAARRNMDGARRQTGPA